MKNKSKQRIVSVTAGVGIGLTLALSRCDSKLGAISPDEPRITAHQNLCVERRVNEIVAEQLGIDVQKLEPGQRFIADLGADSLDAVVLIMAFEEEFGLAIRYDEAENMLTIGDVVNFLKKHQKP